MKTAIGTYFCYAFDTIETILFDATIQEDAGDFHSLSH